MSTIIKVIPTAITPFICMKGCYSFVLDTSDSMYSNNGDNVWTQIDIAKHAIITFISALDSADLVTIYSYSNNAKLVIKLLKKIIN